MGNYWKNVGLKLKNMGKSLLSVGTPMAIEYSFQVAVDKACNILTKKLNQIYAKSLRNSLITLVLNILGTILLLSPIFGGIASKMVASLVFFAAFVFFIVRQVLFIKNNGKFCLEIGRDIFQKKNLKKGISVFIMEKVPLVAYAYTGVDLLSAYVPELKMVPSLEETVGYFIKTFRKQLIFYLCLISIYTVLIYWILKPLLINKYLGMNWFDLYFFPINYFISIMK